MGIIETIEVDMTFYSNPKSLETSPSKADIYILVVQTSSMGQQAWSNYSRYQFEDRTLGG